MLNGCSVDSLCTLFLIGVNRAHILLEVTVGKEGRVSTVNPGGELVVEPSEDQGAKRFPQ